MVTLESIELNNFLGFGHSQWENINDVGLVCVYGENLDDTSTISNGACKSGLVEAIGWSLQDVMSKKIAVSDIVHNLARKNCYVKTLLQVDGKRYRVCRYKNCGSLGKKDGVEIEEFSIDKNDFVISDLTKSKTADTFDVISDLIGATKDVFLAAIYAGQENFPDLPRMTDSALKEVIEDSIGIKCLSEAHKIACDEYTAQEKITNRAKSDYDANCVNASMSQNNLEITRSQSAGWENEQNEDIQKRKDSIVLLQGAFDALSAKHDEKFKDIIDKDKRLDEIRKELLSANDINKDYEATIVFVNDIASKINRLGKLDDELSVEYGKQSSDAFNLSLYVDISGDSRTQKEIQIDASHENNIRTVKNNIKKIKELYDVIIKENEVCLKLDATIKEVENRPENTCDKCGSDLNGKSKRKYLEALNRDFYDASLRCQSATNEMAYLVWFTQRFKDKCSYEIKQQLQKDKQEKEINEQALSSKSKVDISELIKEQEEIIKFTTLYNTSNSAIENKRQAILKEKEELSKALAKTNPFTDYMKKCEKDLSKLNARSPELYKKYEQENTKLQVLADAKVVFGRSGARAQILDTIRPYLNRQTSQYLEVLSDGNISAEWHTLKPKKDGTYSENFHISASKKSASSNYGGLSGGEKRKVQIATCLALQDLVASRATKPIQFWIADEIDAGLDSAGLERLMLLLEEKAANGVTVIVISHNDLSSWIRNSITVERKNGYSRIREG